jgi:hypothetical protein
MTSKQQKIPNQSVEASVSSAWSADSLTDWAFAVWIDDMQMSTIMVIIIKAILARKMCIISLPRQSPAAL